MRCNESMFNYEKLEAWQNAISFADVVSTATRNFPPDERFGLTNQMRRAAVSISSNLAEGCSRSSSADYARFVELAAGSLFEVISQATIARTRAFGRRSTSSNYTHWVTERHGCLPDSASHWLRATLNPQL